MKKFIFILNALNIMTELMKGEKIEGALYVDKNTRLLTFKPYIRKAPSSSTDKVVCYLENGWVKESPRRYKVYDSFNKRLGMARIISILERDMRDAKLALINKEMEVSL